MFKRYGKAAAIVFLLGIGLVGCVQEDDNVEDEIAYISAERNSTYQKTFEELNLGLIFNYHLKLPRASESWVRLWVEAYSEGERIEPALSVLEYGHSPNEETEGNIGVGIINADNEARQFFLYGPSVRLSPHSIDQDVFLAEGISNYDYAIDKKQVALAPGEEKVIAVYRQSAGNMNAYSYQDEESIEKMINDDAVVILLKIKVDEKIEE